FYKRILDHLTLLQDSGIKLDLSVRIILEYFNTSSSKCLHNLVRKLNVFIEKGHRVQINWYYPYEDEDMKELVEDMNGLFGNKMKVIRAMTH
ncbi:MAG: SiaC family regulatory phosphoprotein, partial [Ekhidna sp.]